MGYIDNFNKIWKGFPSSEIISYRMDTDHQYIFINDLVLKYLFPYFHGLPG